MKGALVQLNCSAVAGEQPMCRWNAHIGERIMLDELLCRTEHGLIDQSLHSRMGAETTNGTASGSAGSGAHPSRHWKPRAADQLPSISARSRSRFVFQDVSALRKLHPDNPRLQRPSDADHAIVSEPLRDLPGAWLEAPHSAVLVFETGSQEQRPFRPQPPWTTADRKRPVGREV